METKDHLTNYYEGYDEERRLTSKHRMVEYVTTMKYVEKYLRPNMRVLEIGAATGRYSHAFARQGYRVRGFISPPRMVTQIICGKPLSSHT
ncbi:MAG: class I SAM-dependent methyltransferase [Lachnospiraceae bacterium]|nr:class I SAM-dependent methyltransferase [Lachnospiraceae bacterium]